MPRTIRDRRTRHETGRPALQATWAACAFALVVAACGQQPAPDIDPGTEPDSTAVAPACDEVDELVAVVPDGEEPTGTTPEPTEDPLTSEEPDGPDRDEDDDPATASEEAPGLGQQIPQWGDDEAPDSFAGMWMDQDLGGYAVAFTENVDEHAEQVRERFHPGIAVAEADNTYAELRDTQERIAQEQPGANGSEPDDVRSIGTQVMINRTTVGVFDPDEERLAELSDTYGASTICFEVEQPPGPVAEGLDPLVKAPGFRDGLQAERFAMIEIADDRETAERAWHDNVPDGVEPRDDDLPAEPGMYGELGDVDFTRQAVVVWSSGESGSCPGWLADIDTRGDVVQVERGATEQTCTDDYNPYRMLLAVDRDRLPSVDDLPHQRIEGVPDGEIRSYPEDDRAPGQQSPPPEQVPDGPRETSSRIAEELLETDPTVAVAGDTVELRFAERTERGRAYALERQTGDSWQWSFSLTSDGQWWHAGAEVDVPDDVYYDTSVTVPLPDPADAGSYRICTTHGDCAEVTIE